MVRTRILALTLASGLPFLTGCLNLTDRECIGGSGFLSRFRLASRTAGADCDCQDAVIAGAEGPVLVPPTTFTPPTFMPPSPSPLPAPPPRIVPVPQAIPMPYSPQ